MVYSYHIPSTSLEFAAIGEDDLSYDTELLPKNVIVLEIIDHIFEHIYVHRHKKTIHLQQVQAAPKLYFTLLVFLVIILITTVLYKSVFSVYSFVKLNFVFLGFELDIISVGAGASCFP